MHFGCKLLQEAAAVLERKMAAMEALLVSRRNIAAVEAQQAEQQQTPAVAQQLMEQMQAPTARVGSGPGAGNGYEILLQVRESDDSVREV